MFNKSAFTATTLLAACLGLVEGTSLPRNKIDGCTALQQAFPTKTFFPGSDVYDYEALEFWSNQQLMNPGCIFRPNTSDDVSGAIKTICATASNFAVRGGGHMGIRGANNIDDDVLMVMSNLTTMSLSDDHCTLTVGPGYKWGTVYSWLSQYDLTVAGGRLSPVGVPGLLLAGGINFHGNQHGWAADNVLEYEVVLASGDIVIASATHNKDLFWALKGGSSNFGIVTSFTLRAFKSTKVWAGTYTVSGDHIDDLFAAVANYSAFNTDPLSHIVPMTVPATEDSAVGAVILFYDSDTVSEPDCFANFLAIPAIANTCDFKTLSDFSVETGGLVVDHINDMFIAGTVVGNDYDTLLQGIRITNDVFFGALPALYEVVPFANISLISIDWQPIGSLWQAGSEAANPTGNPLGLDIANKGTYLAWAEVVEWIGDEHADAVMSWVQNTTAAIESATKAAGIYDHFNYMGDAAGFQDVHGGYGAQNEARLLDISRKYDPARFFQTRLPGGFKIGI